MLTQLQAKSAQSRDLTASSWVNSARRSHNLRQGNAVVHNPSEERSPSSLLANWRSENILLSIHHSKKSKVIQVTKYIF